MASRTQCLLISSNNATAFISPTSKSASSSTRKRTRISSPSTSDRKMTLFTLIYISLAVITLVLSPSAYAEGCTPLFILRNDNGTQEGPLINNKDEDSKNEVVVREGTSFVLACELSHFHHLRWTLNNREITSQIADEWDMYIETEKEVDGYVYSELVVNNASIHFHPGEYKCTPLCLDSHAVAGAGNLGVTVTVSLGLNVTLNTNISFKEHGKPIFQEFVARSKLAVLQCTAHVPDATLKWYRILSSGSEEDMDSFCGQPDVELSDRKKPPVHCKMTRESKSDSSVVRLELKRVRKEGNDTLGTISDFRRYVCKAQQGPNVELRHVELKERVSASRPFDHRGAESLTVTEGEKLEIYCDIHGVDQSEFHYGKNREPPKAVVTWTKDGEPFDPLESNDIIKINSVQENEKGKPYRSGYRYTMAERDHRGNYSCIVSKPNAANQDAGSSDKGPNPNVFAKYSYLVRVKDKLGALWPFLGICGEVIILCTIILIYEKRKSKTELEESDTDGSPDQ